MRNIGKRLKEKGRDLNTLNAVYPGFRAKAIVDLGLQRFDVLTEEQEKAKTRLCKMYLLEYMVKK
jgi:hypothetical protein